MPFDHPGAHVELVVLALGYGTGNLDQAAQRGVEYLLVAPAVLGADQVERFGERSYD
jgi:hypothetical protein